MLLSSTLQLQRVEHGSKEKDLGGLLDSGRFLDGNNEQRAPARWLELHHNVVFVCWRRRRSDPRAGIACCSRHCCDANMAWVITVAKSSPLLVMVECIVYWVHEIVPGMEKATVSSHTWSPKSDQNCQKFLVHLNKSLSKYVANAS